MGEDEGGAAEGKGEGGAYMNSSLQQPDYDDINMYDVHHPKVKNMHPDYDDPDWMNKVDDWSEFWNFQR